MRFKEQLLWDSMRNNIASRNMRLERIENGLAPGIPDVLCISFGVVTWVELKAVPEWPARETTSVLGKQDGLNVEQINWHLDWHLHRGRSFVLIGVGRGVARELILVPGGLAQSINSFDAWKMKNYHMRNWATIKEWLI